jgi:hypothetical protein
MLELRDGQRDVGGRGLVGVLGQNQCRVRGFGLRNGDCQQCIGRER